MNGERVTFDPDPSGLDEVWLRGVDMHLERMDDGSVWIGVYRDGEPGRLVVWLNTRRNALIVGSAEWDGPAWDGVEWVTP